ncbi:PD-(D/E)XK nuclease family protein [Candidatus Bipolaricaulota bacterium]|nr:PD-(D/E)XK nuclease family protein [Candidatus Bipolaricaulota bacterium]
MRVKRSLTVDEIYRQVKGYDLVLTVEASLADALNNRVEKPGFGKLSYTPRNLIRRKFQNEDLNHDEELFQHVIRETDLSWKEASHILKRTVSYWREVGNLEAFTERTSLNREKVKKLLPVLENTSNIYGEMEDYRVPADKEVCVVGLYQFTGLDRSVLPEYYDTLNLFKNEKVQLEPFRVFESAGQVVGATIDNISKVGERSTAVVVHPDSIYNSLLRSYLRGEGIDFQVAQKLRDSDSLRTLLEVLILGLRRDRLKLKDAASVFGRIGMSPPKEKEEEYLAKTDSPEMREASDILKRASEHTFGKVVETLRRSGISIERELDATLRDLCLWSEPVTMRGINNLQYYLDSFSVEIDKSDSGVLLVNPGAVAYIDRPVVFYLGMSTQWDRNVERRPWKDLSESRHRNVNNFKVLLQAGDRQLYMVQSNRLNREVTPSTYFNELQPDLSGFTEGEEGKDYTLHKRSGPAGSSFNSNQVNVQPEPVTTLSKTELNELVQCPRDHFFSRLVEEPDREYLRQGIVFHEFAEFYANFPEFVEEEDPGVFVELMVERMNSIVDEREVPILRTKFRLGIKLLKSYFRNRNIGSGARFSGNYSSSKEKNYFARQFERNLNRQFTEMVFLNEKIGARGKVDLLNGNELIDFKTGRIRSPRQVVKNSNPDLFEESPDFQALLYLAHHRRALPREKLEFTFLHVLEDPGRVLRGDFDPRDYVTSVTYYPWTFSEFLTRDEVYQTALSSKKRAKLLEPLGKENFLKVLSRLDFSPGDFYSKEKAKKHRSQFEELCRDYVELGRGKDLTEKQLKKASSSVLKTTLQGLRTRNFFREDVDEFEEFLEEILVQLNEWSRTRFPVGENDLDEVGHRDLILAGEGR